MFFKLALNVPVNVLETMVSIEFPLIAEG